MTKPLRPSLKFISKLPTIKIKEIVETTNMVIWEVELDKPVNIFDGGYLTFNSMIDLNVFYVEAITCEQPGNGWHYYMKIGITRCKGGGECLISHREEEWYLKNTWWKWS